MLIDAEDVTSGKTIAPAPIGQVSYDHVLAVWLVLICLGTVASVETDLHKITHKYSTSLSLSLSTFFSLSLCELNLIAQNMNIIQL